MDIVYPFSVVFLLSLLNFNFLPSGQVYSSFFALYSIFSMVYGISLVASFLAYLIVLRFNEASLTVFRKIKIILTTLISCICNYILKFSVSIFLFCSEKNQRFYSWDNLHNEIEVFDRFVKHLGVMDPTTGEMIKSAVKGRWLKL